MKKKHLLFADLSNTSYQYVLGLMNESKHITVILPLNIIVSLLQVTEHWVYRLSVSCNNN